MFTVLDILGALGESGGNPALMEISKAMTTMGQGTELTALTGGGAFRIENMDPVLASATIRQEHFKFFKRLMPNRRLTFSVIDQAVVKTDIGAFFGSANSDEIGAGQEDRQGQYDRLITQLGTYFSRRSVSIVTAQQAVLQNKNGVVDFSAVDEEDINSALEILLSLEWDLFLGDNTKNPLSATGVIPSVISRAPQNVIDMVGEPLQSHVPLSTLAAEITTIGNWGKPELVFMSSRVKGDLDAKLESGYRVNLDTNVPNVNTGVLVKGMQYSSVAAADGMLGFDPHALLTEDMMPVSATSKGAALCTGAASVGVVATTSVGVEPLSQFLDKTSGIYKWTVGGDYVYAVEAYSAGKVSLTTLSNTVTLAAGHNNSLAISPSSGNAETYYKVYRSRKDGTSAINDFRLIAIVKKNIQGGVTTFVDNNDVLPGSSYAAMLTMDPQSVRWCQMLSMTKIPFALNDLSFKWGTFLVGALRTALPQHHGVIRNIIPTTATWLPF
jgi:hypothetical protein